MGYEAGVVASSNDVIVKQEQRTLLIIAMSMAVVALGIAVFSLNRTFTAHPAGQAAVAALNREVRSLKSELETAQRTAAEASAKQRATLSKLTTCIPELSAQINGLSVETSTLTLGERQFVTGAYLNSGKQVSTYCQPLLEPRTPGIGR